jgi:hypothetical protein
VAATRATTRATPARVTPAKRSRVAASTRRGRRAAPRRAATRATGTRLLRATATPSAPSEGQRVALARSPLAARDRQGQVVPVAPLRRDPVEAARPRSGRRRVRAKRSRLYPKMTRYLRQCESPVRCEDRPPKPMARWIRPLKMKTPAMTLRATSLRPPEVELHRLRRLLLPHRKRYRSAPSRASSLATAPARTARTATATRRLRRPPTRTRTVTRLRQRASAPSRPRRLLPMLQPRLRRPLPRLLRLQWTSSLQLNCPPRRAAPRRRRPAVRGRRRLRRPGTRRC